MLTLSNGHDVRGNMVDAGGARFYEYSVLNQATSIWRDNASNPTIRARFAYGSDGQRYRRIDDGSTLGGTTTTTYIGNVERRQLPGGSIQWRRTVAGVVLIEHYGDSFSGGIIQASGMGTVRHQFTDHLGSVQVIGSVSGSSITVLERLDTDAHGEWRTPSPPFGQAGSSHTSRGFTGHEHLNGLDTLHMNGRLYWASGGRMVQPDPIITDPLNPQNWNPYSYVMNNPLNLIDPSGYSFVDYLFNPHKGLFRSVMRALGPRASGIAVGVGCSFAPGPWAIACAAGGSYDMARAFGASSSDARRSGVSGAFTALVSWGVGKYGGNPSYYSRVGISATAGGVASVIQGGKFGHGFASAGVTAAASPYIYNANTNPVAGAVAASILGGTVSEMTGGKFANGAVTGAFSYVAVTAVKRVHAASRTGRKKFTDPAIARAAMEEANAALSLAPENGFDSSDDAAMFWSDAVQPVTDKYNTEIGSKMFIRGGRHFLGPAHSDGVICLSGYMCTVNVDLASEIRDGALTGWIHTHPDNNNFSASDVGYTFYLYDKNSYSGRHISGYVSLPNRGVYGFSSSNQIENWRPSHQAYTELLRKVR